MPTKSKPTRPKSPKPASPKSPKPARPKPSKPARTKSPKPARPKPSKPARPKPSKPARTKSPKPARQSEFATVELPVATAIHYAFAVGSSVVLHALRKRVETEKRVRVRGYTYLRRVRGQKRRVRVHVRGYTRIVKLVEFSRYAPQRLAAHARRVVREIVVEDEDIARRIQNVRAEAYAAFESDINAVADGMEYRVKFIGTQSSNALLNRVFWNELQWSLRECRFQFLERREFDEMIAEGEIERVEERASWETNVNGAQLEAYMYGTGLVGLDVYYTIEDAEFGEQIRIVRVWVGKSK